MPDAVRHKSSSVANANTSLETRFRSRSNNAVISTEIDMLPLSWKDMVSLRLECNADQKDELVAALWEDGTQGITEVDLNANRVELRAFFEEEFDAAQYAAHGARWE